MLLVRLVIVPRALLSQASGTAAIQAPGHSFTPLFSNSNWPTLF